MVFSSISFLYYFLAIFLGLYFIVPKKFKNSILLVSSLLFYFYGEPSYILIMLLSIVSGYLHGLWIDYKRNTASARVALISSIVVSGGFLIFFKYTNFFIKNINHILSVKIPPLAIVMPIGISFYTFQILSYVIDVYRGDAKVQKNIFNFATYVALFPQLIAGPIVRYTDVENELETRTHSLEKAAYGVWRFVIGLSKKVIFANSLGEICKIISKSDENSVFYYWMAAVLFALQIYYDFSGYSDMAIGLGRIFGFHFLENFNYPFISKSITEFWRRWHMSLGTWFRDYVYIPMGGNRVSKLKWVRNILVVWFLTGFWHGAEWNFIVWGLYFALLLALEKLFIKKLLDKTPDIFKHLYVFFFITVSFVIFNANSMGEAIGNIKGMFGLQGVPLITTEALYYARSYFIFFIIALIGATPIPAIVMKKISSIKAGEYLIHIGKPATVLMLLLVVTGYLIDGSFNPFLYFRF